MSSPEQNDRHIIWSDISLDLDDWRESLEELYPGYSDDELYDIMVKSNAENLYDERVNLNIQLSQPIIVIGDLGRWNGRVSGYKMIDSGNIKDCLYSDTDYTEWYVDKYGDLRADAVHHDGTNHYLYRVFKDGVTDTQIENLQDKIYNGKATRADITRVTKRLGDEIAEVYGFPTTRDQRMMFAVLTMVHTADSKEQLDNDTEALLTTARKHLCQFAVLKYQQMDGLNTAMPFGTRKIDAFRTLTTESLAVFIPFRVQDIYHENGIYYGQNVISKNMIIADRRQLLNGNSFILGVSGGGKSFAAKGEIENIILSSNADVIIIDPEREYSQLVKALGGEIINISATSPSHINAMDMNKEYDDGANPVILKSEFIMSLCEQLIGGTNLGAKQKSIIDRCTASVYRDYQQRGYTGTVPTLQDFRAELLKQDEPEAKEIALAIELFTHGSLNTFAKPTNVDTDNRLICYDILDLGKQLMPIGMLVVLDSILNRITQNRAKGKQTFIFIDEIYLLFQHEYSANFLFTLWKRVRKYGAYATGITQNVDDLLQSHTARTMLANSEFLIMLNQASTDRIELAKLLNISDLQLSYITNVDAGHGLIKVGSSLVPFANKFPKNTKLYKLMTTKPGEGV